MLIWTKIIDQRQAATVFLVTLLVPEWVLAWALRQFFTARSLSKKLEEARKVAGRRQETGPLEGREAEKRTSESTEKGVDDEPLAEFSRMSTHSESDRLIKRQVISQEQFENRQCKGQCGECGLRPSADDVRTAEYDQVAVAQRVAKANEGELSSDWIYPYVLTSAQHGR